MLRTYAVLGIFIWFFFVFFKLADIFLCTLFCLFLFPYCLMQLNYYHLAAKILKVNKEPHVKLQSHDQGHPRHHELLWDQRLLKFQRVGGLLSLYILTRLSAYCSVDHHSWSTNLSRALGMQHFLSLPFLQMHFRNLLWFQWPLTFLPQAENGPCKD